MRPIGRARGERIAPHAADARADHAVAPERDLDVIDMVAHVGMRTRDVGQHGVRPFRVAGPGELLANACRVLVGERVVPGPHGGAAIPTALMRRAYVTEARAVAKHVVPRRRRTAASLDRARAQVDVRDRPRTVLASGLAAPRAHDPVGHERRGRDDHGVSANAERTSGTDRGDARAVIAGVDIDDRHASLERRAGREVANQCAVAVGPGHDRLCLGTGRALPCREVEQAGPRARLRGGERVVVAACVVAQPAQSRRRRLRASSHANDS